MLRRVRPKEDPRSNSNSNTDRRIDSQSLQIMTSFALLYKEETGGRLYESVRTIFASRR